MEAGAPNGAPQRAREARQAGKYGLRWRARDMRHSARHWLAHASVFEITGTFWLAAGPLLFIAAWASGPLSHGALVPGPVMCVLGAAMRAIARSRGWRR